MPFVQEKLGTVELFRDGKFLESRMHDSPFVHLDFSPTGRSRISSDLAVQFDTRLYPSRLEFLEGLLVNLPLS
jgi:hypothetical protein